jgi:hypothetical protein
LSSSPNLAVYLLMWQSCQRCRVEEQVAGEQ